jgi:hypothetical protein
MKTHVVKTLRGRFLKKNSTGSLCFVTIQAIRRLLKATVGSGRLTTDALRALACSRVAHPALLLENRRQRVPPTRFVRRPDTKCVRQLSFSAADREKSPHPRKPRATPGIPPVPSQYSRRRTRHGEAVMNLVSYRCSTRPVQGNLMTRATGRGTVFLEVADEACSETATIVCAK